MDVLCKRKINHRALYLEFVLPEHRTSSQRVGHADGSGESESENEDETAAILQPGQPISRYSHGLGLGSNPKTKILSDIFSSCFSSGLSCSRPVLHL